MGACAASDDADAVRLGGTAALCRRGQTGAAIDVAKAKQLVEDHGRNAALAQQRPATPVRS